MVSVSAQTNPSLSTAQLAINLKKPKIEVPQKAAEDLFREKVIKSCEFKLISIEPAVDIKAPKIGLKGVDKPEINIVFKVQIDVTNNSDLELQTSKVDFMLFADGKPIPPEVTDPTATGAIAEPHKFPIGQTVTLPVDMKVPPEKATQDLASLVKSETVQYRVDGVFYFKHLGMEIAVKVTLVEAKEKE
ncbi:MAG: hypothetical protein V2A61_05895 [Calditrichota bacterium]